MHYAGSASLKISRLRRNVNQIEQYRTKKLSNLQKRLKSTLGNKEDTSRLFFNRDEYQKLLTKSKQRIKSAEQGGLDGGKKVAFNRKLLHQFIIFGVKFHSDCPRIESFRMLVQGDDISIYSQ